MEKNKKRKGVKSPSHSLKEEKAKTETKELKLDAQCK